MKSRKATITMQTGRKKSDQPFILELPGKTAKQERYATLRTACKGAVRAHREWLIVDTDNREVVMTLPDGRKRRGHIWYSFLTGNYEVRLQDLRDLKPAKK